LATVAPNLSMVVIDGLASTWSKTVTAMFAEIRCSRIRSVMSARTTPVSVNGYLNVPDNLTFHKASMQDLLQIPPEPIGSDL